MIDKAYRREGVAAEAEKESVPQRLPLFMVENSFVFLYDRAIAALRQHRRHRRGRVKSFFSGYLEII